LAFCDLCREEVRSMEDLGGALLGEAGSEQLAPDDGLAVQFRTAAYKFQLIDESVYRAVIVRRNGESKMLLGKLEKDGPDRWLMRKLQRYTVNIPEYQFIKLEADQEIREIWSGIFAQHSDTLYHPDLGLMTEAGNPAAEGLIV